MSELGSAWKVWLASKHMPFLMPQLPLVLGSWQEPGHAGLGLVTLVTLETIGHSLRGRVGGAEQRGLS